MIERFLGPCDETCDNPHYKSADPMRLWRIARVLWAEQTDDVRDAVAQAKARRAKRRGLAAAFGAKPPYLKQALRRR